MSLLRIPLTKTPIDIYQHLNYKNKRKIYYVATRDLINAKTEVTE